jgi:hypothetical protein
MKRRWFGLILLLVLARIPTPMLSAADAPQPDRDRVRQLVGQLGDRQFKVRALADAELRRLGTAAVPLIRKELAKAGNVEVRTRLERIVASLAPALRDAGRVGKPVLVFSTIGEVDGFC